MPSESNQASHQQGTKRPFPCPEHCAISTRGEVPPLLPPDTHPSPNLRASARHVRLPCRHDSLDFAERYCKNSNDRACSHAERQSCRLAQISVAHPELLGKHRQQSSACEADVHLQWEDSPMSMYRSCHSPKQSRAKLRAGFSS